MKLNKKLSPTIVEAAKPEAAPYRIWDTAVPQLFLRVQPSGVKSWNVQWTRNHSKSLGKWPGITVESARTKARASLGEADRHGAPLAVIEAAKPNGGRPLTLRQFVEGDYQAWARHELKRGQEAVNRVLSVFEPLADALLPKVDRKAVEDIITKRRAAGASKATTNRDLTGIKAVLSKAVEWNLLEVHPLAGVKPSKVTSGNVVRYLSRGEENRLRESLSKREASRRAQRENGNAWRKGRGSEVRPVWADDGFTDHLSPMILVAMNTGLRRGELFGLRWDDVNLIGRSLAVKASNAKSQTRRDVPLNTEALDVMTRWRDQGSGEGLVFPNATGGRFDNIQSSWEAVTAEAKLTNFRFHDLRHDSASKLVMVGVDLNTVRELLGHGDIKMTLRYAHLAPHKLADAVARIERV
ncbi:MAG: site-specific integrase [Luteimonas sp.]